ncbi:hypothetical protein TrRE_jg10911 [Triparma retinervis]|uniref:50S ribosomal protein L10 n=1 Tax=Triparma retinervis TaxID=2557542 RepID=A0A9W7DQL5_9STRA|nr:hypothetical protein TrRE_jg10911 [Triparma retinervis]
MKGLLFAVLVPLVTGFVPVVSHVSSTALYGGAKGGATSLEGKQARVAFVKDKLSTAEMIFSVPSEKITVSQSLELRNSLPEGTTCAVIKNSLMARAIADNGTWESSSSLLKGSNMWFFIDSDISGTLKGLKSVVKSNGLEDTKVRGGVIDGSLLDAAGVAKIGELPSKMELIARIAGGINAVPTKLARVVKAPNSKLARAIKLAGEENGGE